MTRASVVGEVTTKVGESHVVEQRSQGTGKVVWEEDRLEVNV